MVPMIVDACCAPVVIARLIPIRCVRGARFAFPWSAFARLPPWMGNTRIRNRLTVSSQGRTTVGGKIARFQKPKKVRDLVLVSWKRHGILWHHPIPSTVHKSLGGATKTMRVVFCPQEHSRS